MRHGQVYISALLLEGARNMRLPFISLASKSTVRVR
jgi:hypothetical protein